MSHISKVKIDIRDLEALRRAAETCGLTFRHGQLRYKWYGQSVGDYPLPDGVTVDQLGKCDHALSVRGNPSAYEIGVVAMGDSYSLLWDFWQGGWGLESCVGPSCSKLVSEYGLEVAIGAAQSQGWYCERQADQVVIHHPDGGTITVDAAGAVDASNFQGADCISACAPIEGALGSQSERALKAEFYSNKQYVNQGGE
jgi:hypothetical protein